MSFEVNWRRKAIIGLKKIPQDIALRIWSKIESIKEDPFRYLKHLEGSGYKLRIGNYRALIDVDSQKKILIVRIVDKRGRVYKR
jgi:mRNA interferase RelE/StbE